jgi:glycosyltransferase involved in cell wall biosynthesis
MLIDAIAERRPRLLSINGCTDFAIGAAPLLRRLRRYCTIVDVFHADFPDDEFLEQRLPYIDVLDGIAATSRRTIDRFRRYDRRARAITATYAPCGIEVRTLPRAAFDGTFRLLYAGRLIEEQKRVSLLPAIAAALRDRGVPFRLTVAGDGPAREPLARQFDELGLRDVVDLRGFVDPDDMPGLYASHDLLLNVSTYEGFAITAMEAFAAGCVPLATRLESLDWSVFRDGENCLLVPVDDPVPEIVETLSALRPERLARLSAAATESGGGLTIEKTFADYETFFADLQRRRPLEPWPADARLALAGAWDPSARNPWLPGHTLARKIAIRLRRLQRRLFNRRAPR